MILGKTPRIFFLSILLIAGGGHLAAMPSTADANDQKKTDDSMIMVYATPNPEVSFFLIDQSGNRSGWDVQRERMLKEIAGSNILDESVEDPKPFYVLYVNRPPKGHYKVIVAGVKDGPIKLVIRTYDQANNAKRFIFRGIAAPDRKYSYDLDFTPEKSAVSSIQPSTYSFEGFGNELVKNVGVVFTRNRPIFVTFSITRRDGNPTEDINAKLLLQKIVEGIPSDKPVESKPASDEYDANFFKYDLEKKQYKFLLDTMDLNPGDWQLIVHLDDGSKHSTQIRIE